MSKPLQRSDVLLTQIVDSLLVTGVAEMSLRPLAERVGTSARLLIYHFDSKENLLACALEQVRARAGLSLKARAEQEQPSSLSAALQMFWRWALEEEHTCYFRLLFEVDGLLMFDSLRSSRETRQAGASVWLSLINGAASRWGAADEASPGRSTLIMAALNGLLQDYLSTGDGARTTAALERFLKLISEDNVSVAQYRPVQS